MAKRNEFERLTHWIDRLNSSMEAARADQSATGNMVSSAEYELNLLRRSLSTLRPRAAPAEPPALPAATGRAGEAFNMKLRHPDNAKKARHWLALGS